MRPILSLDYQLESLYESSRSASYLILSFEIYRGLLSFYSLLTHSIAILLSDSNLFIRSEIVFAQAEIVLFSAKLWIEEGSMKKKRSLIEKSNRNGPTISLVVRLK